MSASSQAEQGEIRLVPGVVAAGGHLWSSVIAEASLHLEPVCVFVCVYGADSLAQPSWCAGG